MSSSSLDAVKGMKSYTRRYEIIHSDKPSELDDRSISTESLPVSSNISTIGGTITIISNIQGGRKTMIELSNSAEQVIPVGGAVTFDVVLLKSGCDVCYNSILPTSVKLTRPTIYDVEFQGNMTSTAAATPLQLSIAIAGQSVAQTVMDGTPAAAGDLVNIGAGTYIRACCDVDRISIINSGANPVTLAANSLLRVFSVR